MEFFRDRSPADDRAALEHRDLETGRGQVRGAHQAVMTAADDQGIAVMCNQGRRLLEDSRSLRPRS